jgi:hypothetical protein
VTELDEFYTVLDLLKEARDTKDTEPTDDEVSVAWGLLGEMS